MTDDLYYDGAHDALTEAIGEVKAAMIMGYPDIRRKDYRREDEFWQDIAVRALTNLQESYDADAKFVKKIKAANRGS